MIDIHSYLVEKAMRLDTAKFSDEVVVDTFNLIEQDLKSELKSSYANFNVEAKSERALSKPNNLLIYISADKTFTNSARNALTDNLMNVLSKLESSYLYSKLERKKISTYSKTVDTITMYFDRLGDTKNMKFRFVVKPGEDVKGFNGVNNVRNSDLTELTPIVLFNLYSALEDKGKSKLKPIADAGIVPVYLADACDTTFKKIRKDETIDKKYHSSQFDTLFSNLNNLSVFNKKACDKFIAGVKLYLLLVDIYETDTTEIHDIKLVANNHGYDTVADIEVHTNTKQDSKNVTYVPVSVKSYGSLSESIKLKSVAWYRLITNDVVTTRRKGAIPNEYSTNVGIFNASRNILTKIEANLKTDPVTRDILKTMILGRDASTVMINTSEKGTNIIDKLNAQTLSANEFVNCRITGKTLTVTTKYFTFMLFVRFRGAIPTVDIYFKENSSSVTN